MKINNMNSGTMMIHLQRGTGGWSETTLMRGRSVGGGLPAWKAFGASPLPRSYVDTPITIIIRSSTSSKWMVMLDLIVLSFTPWNSHWGWPLIFKGRIKWLKMARITLGAISTWSFRSSIASSNKRKCCGSDRVGGLDHDSEVSGYSWS